MAKIIWAEPALQDLEQVADYIALDNPKAANELVKKVFRKVDLLTEFPEMCSVPQDLPNSRYRHLLVSPLRIFYRYDCSKEIVSIIYVMRSERELRLSSIEKRDQTT